MLGCFELPECCYVTARVFWWLPGCCYTVDKVFLVAMLLLCSSYCVLNDCQGIAMKLL